jgi:Bacterial Ig-like domain/Bacterial TSP3 repeat
MAPTGKVTPSSKKKASITKGALLKSKIETKKPKGKKNQKVVIVKSVEAKKARTSSIKNKSTKLQNKLAAVESFHTKFENTETVTSGAKHKVLTLRPNIALALLSPYRFPVDTHKLAVGTARLSGIFFALIGAVCTLFFANGAFSTQNQLASLQNTIEPGTTAIETIINCDDPLQYLSASCEDKVDQDPDATFSVQGDRTALSGSVRIQVSVAHAERVRFIVLERSTNENIQVGLMNKTTSGAWELNWNTSQYKDGDYRLKVLIDNGYGSYEDSDSSNVTVSNYPLQTTPTVPNATSTNTIGTNPITPTTTESTLQTTQLTVEKPESADEFRFEIKVKSAAGVKLYAEEKATAKRLFLGNAYQSSTGVWKFRWIAKDAQNGEYNIIAQAIVNGVANTGATVTVTKIADSSGRIIATSTPILTDADLEPEVNIDIQANFPLVGEVGIKVDVALASKVELYALPKNSLQKKYLGNASKVDIDTWIYRFNTVQVPNGEYVLIAQVTNAYGVYEQSTNYVKVANAIVPALTQIEKEKIETLEEVQKQASEALIVEDTPGAVALTDDQKTAETLIAVFSEKIESTLELLMVAIRAEDATVVSKLKLSLQEIQDAVIKTIPETSNVQKVEEYIRAYFVNEIAKIEREIVLAKKIIEERTEDDASLDSDKDGITNYDEVTLYKTNPFIPDTDNDGFTDGVEILNGHDPIDETPEVLVTYESPKEEGIVREDILEVHAITTALQEAEVVDAKPQAIITGKGLPNSFVTLYIFSTPIIVTLKTESDGSWSYRFDKEIEDGEHQVYVGITDNAGKIVAKSNPFAFVKEAQAFTAAGVDEVAAPVPVIETKNSFLSEYMIYLILSVSVVAIGLVLIILGMHLDTRGRRSSAEADTLSTAL